MAKEIVWSESVETAYGRKNDFSSKEDFEKTVQGQYEDGDCEVIDITVEACIYSEETLTGDCLIPLSQVEVCIENYYIGKVVPIEPSED